MMLFNYKNKKIKYSIFRILGNELPPRDDKDARLNVLKFILENEPKFANAQKCWIVNCIADIERREEICELLKKHDMYHVVIPMCKKKYLDSKNRNEKIINAIGINKARNIAIKHGKLISKFTILMDGDCFFNEDLWNQTIEEISQDQKIKHNRKYYTIPTSRSTFEHSLKSKKPMLLAEPMNVFRDDSDMYFDENIAFGEGDKLLFLFKLNHSKEFGKNHILINENICKSVGMVHHVTASDYEFETNTKLRIELRKKSLDLFLKKIENPEKYFSSYISRKNKLPNEYWKKIHGYFDFQGLYSHFAWKEENDAKIVEVGSWQGASICYLATEIKNRKKNIKLFAVDTWEGSDEKNHKEIINSMGGNQILFEKFKKNLIDAGVEDLVHIMKMKSTEAACKFENNSLDVVFIDASHKYKDVLDDIKSWYPKIKIGGVICGHDYVVGHKVSEAGVVSAVNNFFKGKNLEISIAGRTWLHKKK